MIRGGVGEAMWMWALIRAGMSEMYIAAFVVATRPQRYSTVTAGHSRAPQARPVLAPKPFIPGKMYQKPCHLVGCWNTICVQPRFFSTGAVFPPCIDRVDAVATNSETKTSSERV